MNTSSASPVRWQKPADVRRGRRWAAGLLWLALAPAFAWAGEAAAAEKEAAGGWAAVASVLSRIWNYTLFHVGGTSVMVNQVVVAILIVGMGFWTIRRLRLFLHRRLSRHSRIDASAAAAVESILFYIMLAIVLMFALHVLQIPVTLFAFLGGALAIGLGFGAQNIINNFISGLILMLERPIRIGDLVEVETHRGRVEQIGFRCTRIRRTDGIDMLVPNSSLLEKNVINWTLSDKQVRTHVTVGVIYGSPTDTVAKLLRQAVDENSRVLKVPEPAVVFQDFGDNSLVFDVFFWTEVSSVMDLRLIRSEVRFRIDQLFREAGLVIAFPQRDVHLDTVRPLDVRLISGEQTGGGA